MGLQRSSGCGSSFFLKGLGFKLEQIRSILSDERPERVLVDLLDQQTASLQSGIAEQKQRLDDCLQLRKALTVSASDFVSSTLTDMATVMNTTTTHSLRTTYLVMLAITLPRLCCKLHASSLV